MNIQNPPIFDHIVTTQGQNVKLDIFNLGDLTINAGSSQKSLLFPGGFPTYASMVGYDAVFNLTGTELRKLTNHTIIQGGVLWIVVLFLDFTAQTIYINVNTATGAALATAVTFKNVQLMLWHT